MRFWDSSALVPILVAQEASVAIARVLEDDDEISAWWGTPVECSSAIERLQRDQILSPEGAELARMRLGDLATSWHEVLPSEPVRRSAQRLLRLHPLRAPDALQAAAALVLAEHDPTAFDVICLDTRLTEALRREGFAVHVPA